MRYLRWAAAAPIVLLALALPYRARLAFTRALAALVHLPFRIFGGLAGFILRRLRPEAARV